jgi:hypothetical protein
MQHLRHPNVLGITWSIHQNTESRFKLKGPKKGGHRKNTFPHIRAGQPRELRLNNLVKVLR